MSETVTRKLFLSIQRKTMIQGCPTSVLNEERALGKLLAGNKFTEHRKFYAVEFKIKRIGGNRLKKTEQSSEKKVKTNF